LFDSEGRPRLAGLTFGADFKPALRVLGLQDDIDFMASQPMVLRREHFKVVRDFMTERLLPKQQQQQQQQQQLQRSADADFDAAFVLLTNKVLRNETGPEEMSMRHLPCHQCITGSYLWDYRRSDYSWHLLWRAPRQPVQRPKVPAVEHLCPQLHVASHLGCWGQDGACLDLKRGGSSSSNSSNSSSGVATVGGTAAMGASHRYMMKSAELLLVALCGVRRALLEVFGTEGITLADQVVLLGRDGNLPQQLAAEGRGVVESLSPEALCLDIAKDVQLVRGERWPPHQALLLGLGNTVFWRDESAGHCDSREDLMEQWEFNVARVAQRL